MTDEFSNRIDVHFHYLSPEYREKMIDAVGGSPDGFAAPHWSAEAALAMMDRMNIATGMLSVSSPGVHFGNDAKARLLARSVNEFAARTMGDHRGRFGGFASLPLPDVDGALEEIAYALDTLKLDGVVMLTNFNGVYLGDKRLDPVFDELNRRGAVVFIHPTSPICWQQSALGYPRPMIEFTFDSTRAVVNLIFSGTTTRCPKVRIHRAARGWHAAVPRAANRHVRPRCRPAARRVRRAKSICAGSTTISQDRPDRMRSRRYSR